VYRRVSWEIAFGRNGKFASNKRWKILRWKSIAGQERSPRRHIIEDDILQSIIAYIEICDLQHNGRRAARISASLLLGDLLVVPLLAAIPVSDGVGFRQSIERIWETPSLN